MSYVIVSGASLVVGALICLGCLLWSIGWDSSNMTNILRVFSHLATHPDDFSRFQYEDGKKPFWYLGGDEFSDVVKTRPNEKDKK